MDNVSAINTKKFVSPNIKNATIKNVDYSIAINDEYNDYNDAIYKTEDATDLTMDEVNEILASSKNQVAEEKKEEKSWWDNIVDFVDTAFDYTATAIGSVASGVLDVVENITDGLVMAGGAIVAGATSIFDKDLANEMKKGVQGYVEYDWSEQAYDATMNAIGVDDDIAHSWVHTAGNVVGSVAGYAAISLIPGGAAVTMAAGALGAAGGAAEQAFNSGATFEEALGASIVAGGVGTIVGNKVGKFGEIAKGAGSGFAKGVEGAGKELFKASLKSGAVSMLEPIANTTTQYLAYGQNMVDENGNKLYNGIDGYFKYYADSGGILNTAVAGLAGTGGTALQGYKSYKTTNKEIFEFKNEMNKKFNESDVTALLQDASISDLNNLWRKRDIAAFAHNFDGVFGKEKIDLAIDRIHKVKDSDWPTFLKERGQVPTVLGFVDGNSNLYLPESANVHTAYHETFHLLSEINGNRTVFNGQSYKVTGIREIYNDGITSTWANESLTDYLASKYSDGKIYNSIYGKDCVKLWDRLDDAITEAYGSTNSDLLLNAYISNDTTQIRNFFNAYSTKGSYDDFVRTLEKTYSAKYVEDIISSIEKNVNKSNNSFGSRIKNLFGRK